jgi:hypothetical protein
MVGDVLQRDDAALQSIVVVYTAFVVGINLLADLVHGRADPRIRYSQPPRGRPAMRQSASTDVGPAEPPARALGGARARLVGFASMVIGGGVRLGTRADRRLWRPRVENVLMRLVDIFMAFPNLLLGTHSRVSGRRRLFASKPASASSRSAYPRRPPPGQHDPRRHSAPHECPMAVGRAGPRPSHDGADLQSHGRRTP